VLCLPALEEMLPPVVVVVVVVVVAVVTYGVSKVPTHSASAKDSIMTTQLGSTATAVPLMAKRGPPATQSSSISVIAGIDLSSVSYSSLARKVTWFESLLKHRNTGSAMWRSVKEQLAQAWKISFATCRITSCPFSIGDSYCRASQC